jgi:hypothetical protein
LDAAQGPRRVLGRLCQLQGARRAPVRLHRGEQSVRVNFYEAAAAQRDAGQTGPAVALHQLVQRPDCPLR